VTRPPDFERSEEISSLEFLNRLNISFSDQRAIRQDISGLPVSNSRISLQLTYNCVSKIVSFLHHDMPLSIALVVAVLGKNADLESGLTRPQ
jgi:hypothetical protein